MRHQLQSLFGDSLTEFLAEEANSIEDDCSEQMLCGRLAMILERRAHELGLAGYKADTEYNRNFGGKIKTIINEAFEVIPIRCDIIFHSRGSAEKDNLIAIEMKKQVHTEEATQRDRERLKAMTRPTYDNVWDPRSDQPPEHICGYELGYLLILDRKGRSVRVEEYAVGERADVRRERF